VTLPQRLLGGLHVSAVGIGGARWALVDRPDDAVVTATIHAALDSGVTLFDTARAYTPPGVDAYGERVLAGALCQHPNGGAAVVVTKGGHMRLPDGSFVVDARPATLRRHCLEAMTRLRRDPLDAFLLHWPDPQVDLVESVQALADLRREGLARLVGVCNVDVRQLRRAQHAAPIDLVQNPWSVLAGGDEDVVAFCGQHDIGYLGYSPFGGTAGASRLAHLDGQLAPLAERHAATVHELALAWLLHTRPEILPVVGAGRPSTARAAARAGALRLDAGDLQRLDAALVPDRIGQRDG
jgi:aryl-alcohol dehydrogenase-like predicted oxidoreductase